MRIKPHSFLERANVKGLSGHFIYFKKLSLVCDCMNVDVPLHVDTSLWRDLQTPSGCSLFNDLAEKLVVGHLKVYEVCIGLKKIYNLLWQAVGFPWEAYIKMLIRMLLINFIIELAKAC